jgi:hypothetical protein
VAFTAGYDSARADFLLLVEISLKRIQQHAEDAQISAVRPANAGSGGEQSGDRMPVRLEETTAV